jgi:hypothetical protein
MGTYIYRVLAGPGEEVVVDLGVTPRRAPKNIKGIRFAGGDKAGGFTVGPRGYHDLLVSESLIGGMPDGKVTANGREVSIGKGDYASVATFRGEFHDLSWTIGGPRPANNRIAEVFNSYNIKDTANGMEVTPKASQLLDLVAYHVAITVPGYGSIHVLDPRSATRVLPRHAGQRTQHGEIWRTHLADREVHSGPRDHSYILATPTGAAEIFVSPVTNASDDELLTWLDNINVAIPGF